MQCIGPLMHISIVEVFTLLNYIIITRDYELTASSAASLSRLRKCHLCSWEIWRTPALLSVPPAGGASPATHFSPR